jgi:hypothetical protein
MTAAKPIWIPQAAISPLLLWALRDHPRPWEVGLGLDPGGGRGCLQSVLPRAPESGPLVGDQRRDDVGRPGVNPRPPRSGIVLNNM